MCRDGRVKVSRKQRMTLALVELRDRVRNEFLKVAKEWQVSSQELKRDYSRAYPIQPVGAPDLFCLEDACHDVMRTLRCEIGVYAEHYGVTDDVLEAVLLDWLTSDVTGRERTPLSCFIKQTEGGAPVAAVESEDRLPMLNFVLRKAERALAAGDSFERDGNDTTFPKA